MRWGGKTDTSFMFESWFYQPWLSHGFSGKYELFWKFFWRRKLIESFIFIKILCLCPFCLQYPSAWVRWEEMRNFWDRWGISCPEGYSTKTLKENNRNCTTCSYLFVLAKNFIFNWCNHDWTLSDLSKLKQTLTYFKNRIVSLW